MKVAQLFVQGTKEWDVNTVLNTFSAADAELILSTHIPNVSGADRLAWSRTTNGTCSVKTGYKMWHVRNIGVGSIPQSSGWSKLW